MKAHEVEELWQRGYHPTEFVTPELQAVLDMLTSGVLGQRFDDLVDSLLTNRFGTADPYMTLADFQDYARAQRDVAAVYQDKQHFARMSLINIAKACLLYTSHGERQVVVAALAEQRIERHIVQHVVHPAHVPLEQEAEAAVVIPVSYTHLGQRICAVYRVALRTAARLAPARL